MKLKDLEIILKKSWSKETSYHSKKWTSKNPAFGQCAITSLIIQDFFDGKILETVIGGVSHYWNKLPNGKEVDLTKTQFKKEIKIPKGKFRGRNYILSFPDTVRRYKILKQKVLLNITII